MGSVGRCPCRFSPHIFNGDCWNESTFKQISCIFSSIEFVLNFCSTKWPKHSTLVLWSLFLVMKLVAPMNTRQWQTGWSRHTLAYRSLRSLEECIPWFHHIDSKMGCFSCSVCSFFWWQSGGLVQSLVQAVEAGACLASIYPGNPFPEPVESWSYQTSQRGRKCRKVYAATRMQQP